MRWKQKGPGGCFQNERFLAFHKEIAGIFSKRGWVHLDFLTLNREKVAGIYGYTYNGKYYYYLPGLNPNICPETSPGRLLLFQCVCQAIRNGDGQFDLLRGAADYKLAWANGLRRSITMRHYNKTIRAAASKLMDSAKGVVKVLVR
jgi:CelD/BcsL family acetyltransferase involved in cellulose biosynthesis